MSGGVWQRWSVASGQRSAGQVSMKKVLAALVVLAVAGALHADVIVMKDVTLGFGQALDKCREESQLSEEKMEEFFHFWREDFKFEHRELGCAIQCMSHHFNLLTDSSRMHHENTEKFINSFPNGEILAQQMVQLIHGCEKQYDHEPDHCWRILRVAECFKQSCVDRNIAPTMELMMTEFIMEAEARSFVMLVMAAAVWCQIEQSIFSQLYYPRVKPSTLPPATVSVSDASPPLVAARSRRSIFDRDVDLEGKSALLWRMQPKMSDPGWLRDLRLTNNRL